MDSFNFEFIKQVAIFTLKNDLNLSEDEIRAFEDGLNNHLQAIGGKMIEISKDEVKRRQDLAQ